MPPLNDTTTVPAAAAVDPGWEPVLIPPPGAWVEQVTALAAEGLPLLYPPVLPADSNEEGPSSPVGAAEQVAGWWALYPWAPMADVSALLAWAARMDCAPQIERSGDRLELRGSLDGWPTLLVGSSHRLPTDPRVPITLALLERIADIEWRWSSASTDPTVLDAPLIDEQPAAEEEQQAVAEVSAAGEGLDVDAAARTALLPAVAPAAELAAVEELVAAAATATVSPTRRRRRPSPYPRSAATATLPTTGTAAAVVAVPRAQVAALATVPLARVQPGRWVGA